MIIGDFNELSNKENEEIKEYNIEFTLLSADEYEEKNRIGRLKESAFSRFLDSNDDYFWFWTIDKNADNNKEVIVARCDNNGYVTKKCSEDKDYFIFKPVINASKEFIELLKSKGLYQDAKLDCVTFGYYPQSGNNRIAKKIFRFNKNSLFRDRSIEEIGSLGSIDKRNSIYKVDGSYYVYVDGHAFLIEPVYWVIDYRNNRLISRTGLVTGIVFKEFIEEYDSFIDSPMYRYLNDRFAKDLLKFEDIKCTIKKRNPLKTEEKRGEKKPLSMANDLQLMSEIEYNLSLLKEINKNKYEELNDKYKECKNDNCSNVAILAKLSGQIIAEVSSSRKQIDVFSFFDNEKDSCLENFMKGKNNNITFDKLDKIFKIFLEKQKDYDANTKIKLLNDIGLLYFIEAYEKRDILTIEMLENTYFAFHIKSIILWIKYYIEKGNMECSYYLNSATEITIGDMIDIIKNIDIKNNKLTI